MTTVARLPILHIIRTCYNTPQNVLSPNQFHDYYRHTPCIGSPCQYYRPTKYLQDILYDRNDWDTLGQRHEEVCLNERQMTGHVGAVQRRQTRR